ncbi:thiol-activated cytolysin family protein [Capnocytophaga catalasegens]|uniref:Flavomodulin n=1 Tax=Capnocytophaga catalasegens TaxID=1004260 RepID=A0AAV5APE7_9FLAO|nr:thiol-activated cytolysin family protein [Capnocytophaga catalasegens]GIZ14094.1 flavomodulin [Capnocytophaga catalasegens]GJM49092.1 flavomodulin [Capnocytophaga catalasegens]GJM52353.1 flavomodulin [Capnocytophaga catalasegens]
MNLKNLSILSLIVLGSIATSCSKNESFEEKLGGLKQVVFPEVAEQIKSSKPTGRVVGNEIEVIQTVTKQQTLAPVQIVDGKDLDVIYPGSVLDGESFLNGTYNPLVINNPREITLSTTLQGPNAIIKVGAIPVVSDVREKVNKLVSQNSTAVDFSNTAAYLTYISNEVTTIESFSKSFGIHAKLDVLSGLVKANFSFEQTSLTINSKKYVLIKVRQQFYNVTVDPKNADTWGDIQNIGSYEPVYISSVDYGRVAHLLVETDETSAEVTKTIKAGISATFPKIGGNVDTKMQETARNYYKNKRIQIMIAGGPLSTSRSVTDYDSFMLFLQNPKPEDLVKSSAPIGYKVRTLKDNREVEVRTLYTEQRIYPE